MTRDHALGITALACRFRCFFYRTGGFARENRPTAMKNALQPRVHGFGVPDRDRRTNGASYLPVGFGVWKKQNTAECSSLHR